MSRPVEASLRFAGPSGALTYAGPLTPYTVETLIDIIRRHETSSVTLVLDGGEAALTDESARALIAGLRSTG